MFTLCCAKIYNDKQFEILVSRAAYFKLSPILKTKSKIMIKNLLFVLFAVTFIYCQSAFSQTLIHGTVVDVADGRTLIVKNLSGRTLNIQLRFLEVPEAEQPLADVVKNHLKELAVGKKIEVIGMRLLDTRVIGIGTLIEKGNRLDLSGQMLRDGAGWFDIHDATSANSLDFYRETETAARNEKRGVWGISEMKTPWDYRSEKTAALSKSVQKTAAVADNEPDEPSYQKTIKNSAGGKINTRQMGIYDPYFNPAPANLTEKLKAQMMKEGAAGNQGNNLSANLSQIYFAQYNKGTISTKPYNFEVQNGNRREKITAMFVYDYSVENSSKNVGKVGMLFISEINVKPFLQGKNVSVVLEDGTKVNLGTPKYFSTKKAESVAFENIEQSELFTIPASSSLTVMIGKSRTEINNSFKQTIDEFINTLK